MPAALRRFEIFSPWLFWRILCVIAILFLLVRARVIFPGYIVDVEPSGIMLTGARAFSPVRFANGMTINMLGPDPRSIRSATKIARSAPMFFFVAVRLRARHEDASGVVGLRDRSSC